jgi:hypothetical protein
MWRRFVKKTSVSRVFSGDCSLLSTHYTCDYIQQSEINWAKWKNVCAQRKLLLYTYSYNTVNKKYINGVETANLFYLCLRWYDNVSPNVFVWSLNKSQCLLVITYVHLRKWYHFKFLLGSLKNKLIRIAFLTLNPLIGRNKPSKRHSDRYQLREYTVGKKVNF